MGGFVHAKLREFNDPPVCVFIPSAGGPVIKCESSPKNLATLCASMTSTMILKNETIPVKLPLDDTRLRTSFSDGDLKKNENDNAPGFPFYINCVEGCEDSDISLWFRARFSDISWADVVNQDAEFNIEMW